MKVAIGSDHGGFALKEEVKSMLVSNGFEVEDFGCYSTDSIDYNEIAVDVASGVAKGLFERGILVCGTGIGMSIMANKVDGVRCALVHDLFTAKVTREHNNSNVLAMGGRIVGPDLALAIVKTWLDTEFSNVDRHQRRVAKIDNFKE